MKSIKDISVELNYPSDKDTYHNYLPVYQKEFDNTNNIKLLEIGVCYGGSLKLWTHYFIDSEIHGIDNAKYTDEEISGIFHFGKYEDLYNNFEDNYFDYIINDSLHDADSQIEAFYMYFSKLKVGGKFFMEDIPNVDHLNKIVDELQEYNVKIWDMNKISDSKDSIILVITK